jgi:hypothetical protein
MPIQLKEEDGGKILAIHVTGCLVKADYGDSWPSLGGSYGSTESSVSYLT